MLYRLNMYMNAIYRDMNIFQSVNACSMESSKARLMVYNVCMNCNVLSPT